MPGSTVISATHAEFALARYNTDGTLDTTFSGDGKVGTDFGGNIVAKANAVAIQSDGKIVVAGETGNPINFDSYFVVARYNTDGTLDTTFSGNGWVRTGSGNYAYALAIQPNGKLVAAGSGWSCDFVLARYNTDGTPDTNFSGNGKVRTDFTGGGLDYAYAVAVQTDGKIVAAGQTTNINNGDHDFGLVRYNSNGTLDTAFSGDGKVVTGFGAAENARALIIQPNGKLVAAGFRTNSSNSGIEDFALARYNSDGTLDTNFSGNGKTLTDFGGHDRAAALARQPDGKIVAAGNAFYPR